MTGSAKSYLWLLVDQRPCRHPVFFRRLQHGEMAGLGQDHEFRAGNETCDFLGMRAQDHLVILTRDHRCWHDDAATYASVLFG